MMIGGVILEQSAKAKAYDRLCHAVSALLAELEPEHKDRLLSALSADHHLAIEKAVIVAKGGA